MFSCNVKYVFYLIIFLSCGLTVPVSASTVYFNDFQGTVGSEWSHTTVASAPNPDFNKNRLFLGEFSNDTVTLSLNGIPAHSYLSLSFDLFLIRSWDGNDTTVINDPLGPDHWRLSVNNGPVLLDTTFSNGNPAGQAYVPSPFSKGCSTHPAPTDPSAFPAMTGASECYSLGYFFKDIPNGTNEVMDSVYNLDFLFAHSDSSLMLDFSAFNLQGIDDESWGIDNVHVQIATVPLPGAFGLLLAGMAALMGFIRKQRNDKVS